MLDGDERELCAGRSTLIDYAAIDDLHYLGCYQRRVPVSMARMMENALDWEHLPFVHSSSFSDIELIESGPWGWRAKVEAPPAGSKQYSVIELILDSQKGYWATTTLNGPSAGVQIHTQAVSLSADELELEIRFYMEAAPGTAEEGAFVLQVLTDVYTQLYDEDVPLMSGRQVALDGRRRRQDLKANATGRVEYSVGELSALEASGMKIVELPEARFCVRKWQGEWIAHSADCPHLLGPLEGQDICEDQTIVCPWHGYRFDVLSGENRDGKCGGLAAAPQLVERDGSLFLVPQDMQTAI